jgi:hypothetical protein
VFNVVVATVGVVVEVFAVVVDILVEVFVLLVLVDVVAEVFVVLVVFVLVFVVVVDLVLLVLVVVVILANWQFAVRCEVPVHTTKTAAWFPGAAWQLPMVKSP